MSWNQGGGQRQAKLPDPGKGRMRPIAPDRVKMRPDGSRLSPHFTGQLNIEGRIFSISAWYLPANGQMPECFDLRVSDFQPNQGQQQPAQYAQQQPQYAPGPQPPQHGAPQGGYAPQPNQGGWHSGAPPVHNQQAPQQPPQHGAPATGGGYTPAPGYQPPPRQQQAAWGGQTNGNATQPMGEVINDKLPF